MDNEIKEIRYSHKAADDGNQTGENQNGRKQTGENQNGGNHNDMHQPKRQIAAWKKGWKTIGIAAGVIVVLMLVALIFVHFNNRNKLTPSKYIKIEYTGASGYASAVCTVDTQDMYEALAAGQNNEQKLTAYQALVDSIQAQVQDENISNGEKITVQVSFDEAAAQSAGITVTQNEYKVKASGISNGSKINLFENVTITFSGISSQAYATIENKWEDDYLSTLEFSVDKSSDISNGDVVKVTSNADVKELARHGYVAETTSVSYTVDGLSTYVDSVSEIDTKVIDELSSEAIETIVDQTADTTFRMLYKATGDSTYLYELNQETAADVKLLGVYFLMRNDGTQGNLLYLLYEATVTNPSTSAQVYFAFKYSNAFIRSDGTFDIQHDNPEERYTCKTSYDQIYEENIGNVQNLYDIYTIQ